MDIAEDKPPWQLVNWQKSERATVTTVEYGQWIDKTDAALSAEKEKITILEENRQWEMAKKMANPYEMVYTHDDPHFHPSLCILRPLSRSYFKMLEILDVAQFFETTAKSIPKIRTAHVAEGPGGFIQAVIDLAERHKKIVASASAMTLKATDQRVPGWRRATTYLQKHKEVRLHFGVDGTGDIYNMANQESYIVHTGTPVHLFTADGGFDFSVDYQLQEQRVFHLLVCSASIGIRVLAKDGVLVIKIFDVFFESTKIFLCLLGRCFQQWTLYKPAISRPCNSERYFIGRGFRGTVTEILAVFKQFEENSLKELYPTNIDTILTTSEKTYIDSYIQSHTDTQIQALQQATKYASDSSSWYSTQLEAHFKISMNWCQRFRAPTTIKHPVKLQLSPRS